MSQLSVSLEKAKEREATLLEDKAQLELQIRHRSSEYRMYFDMVNKKTRDKNKEMKYTCIVKSIHLQYYCYRILKKSDLQLNVIKDSYKEFEAVYKKVEEKVTPLSMLVALSNGGV